MVHIRYVGRVYTINGDTKKFERATIIKHDVVLWNLWMLILF